MFKLNGNPLEIHRFPDETLRLNVLTDSDSVTIEWLYEKDEEMVLYFVAKHLRERSGVKHLILKMPYIPNARMDRVKNDHEVFTLKYLCDFINDLHFDEVIVRDAHSNVSLALLNRVVQEDLTGLLMTLTQELLSPKRDIVFYPDEGSYKRYSELLTFPCAFGIKKRDWQTGNILGLELKGEIPNQPFNALIIDDISSFGGTFLHAAKALKAHGADKIYLYVTHCENSILSGDLIQSGLIEKIFTTQSIFTGQLPLIKVIGGTHND